MTVRELHFDRSLSLSLLYFPVSKKRFSELRVSSEKTPEVAWPAGVISCDQGKTSSARGRERKYDNHYVQCSVLSVDSKY